MAVFIYVERTCMNPKAAEALSLLGVPLLLAPATTTTTTLHIIRDLLHS